MEEKNSSWVPTGWAHRDTCRWLFRYGIMWEQGHHSKAPICRIIFLLHYWCTCQKGRSALITFGRHRVFWQQVTVSVLHVQVAPFQVSVWALTHICLPPFSAFLPVCFASCLNHVGLRQCTKLPAQWVLQPWSLVVGLKVCPRQRFTSPLDSCQLPCGSSASFSCFTQPFLIRDAQFATMWDANLLQLWSRCV